MAKADLSAFTRSARRPRILIVGLVVLQVDRVPLVAGLGLVPPFMGESGSLRVGDPTITVGDFPVFTKHGARHIQAEFSGFSPARYQLRASGVNPETSLVGVKSTCFRVVEFLSLAASHVPASGSPHGPMPRQPSSRTRWTRSRRFAGVSFALAWSCCTCGFPSES